LAIALPTDGVLHDFYIKRGDAPNNEGLAELGFTLQELATGDYGFVPRDVEAIEAAWLWPELGWSVALFVMRLESGRRVFAISNVGPSEVADEASRERPTVETMEELRVVTYEFDVRVDLKIEEMSPSAPRPQVDERVPGEWLLEIGALNELVALWREVGAAVH
jgi:hypothetical protein